MWHKSKSLNKKLHKAAAVKGQEELNQWIDSIVNHFWFCCQECNGNVSELKVYTVQYHHLRITLYFTIDGNNTSDTNIIHDEYPPC